MFRIEGCVMAPSHGWRPPRSSRPDGPPRNVADQRHDLVRLRPRGRRCPASAKRWTSACGKRRCHSAQEVVGRRRSPSSPQQISIGTSREQRSSPSSTAATSVVAAVARRSGMSWTKRSTAIAVRPRVVRGDIGRRARRRGSGRRVQPTAPAPRQKAFRPRTSSGPSGVLRQSQSGQGNGLPAGRWNAAVLRTTSRAIRSGCRAA